jgi:hypothetical protein
VLAFIAVAIQEIRVPVALVARLLSTQSNWAVTIVEYALQLDEIGGHYCENCHVGNIVPDDVPITAISEGVRAYAVDPNNAEALWKKSEELVGESF